MDYMIGEDEKRAFFVKLLETTAFKARASTHFMSLMLKKVDLNKVHLVTDVTGLAESVTFPVLQSEGTAKYVSGHKNVTAEDVVTHILGGHYDYEDLYVKIDMPTENPMYTEMLSLLETNESRVLEDSDKVMDEIDILLAKATLEADLSKLLLAIDAALDANDSDLFKARSTDYLATMKELESIEQLESDRESAEKNRLTPGQSS